MSLTTMLIRIAIVALVFYIAQVVISKERNNFILRYLQAFTGVLFIFSGWVKAVDPMGTAFKMGDYFAEFESLFEPTALSFLAPLFPILDNYAVAFSVFMIVLEIVLGFMLLFGIYKKFAAWTLMGLVLFFLVLTGFTYLTGYVPEGSSFFQFGNWGPHDENNMKVKDCGCFGDFIKLKPFTSFLKDAFLLIPAFLFLIFNSKMYTILSGKWARITTLLVTLVSLVYSFSNYVWDIPQYDFRPFKKGVNIADEKERQLEVAGNVQVTGFLMQNKQDPSRKMEIAVAEYSDYSDEWEVLEQVTTVPTEEPNKISEFMIRDVDGEEAEYILFEDPEKSVVIVSYQLKGKTSLELKDFTDTIQVLDSSTMEITYRTVTNPKEVEVFDGDPKFVNKFTEKLIPFVNEAKASGMNIYYLVGGASVAAVQDFTKDIGLEATIFTADDILLKTIVRSNPGVLIMEDGKILNKFHISKLPEFGELKL